MLRTPARAKSLTGTLGVNKQADRQPDHFKSGTLPALYSV